MHLDTDNTIYICTDATNGDVTVLVPRRFKALGIHVSELKLDDRDSESTDAAEFQLLSPEMDGTTVDI